MTGANPFRVGLMEVGFGPLFSFGPSGNQLILAVLWRVELSIHIL